MPVTILRRTAPKYVVLAENIILPATDTLEWGGNFNSFKYPPHYKLKTIAQGVVVTRSLFEQGKNFIA